MPIPDDMWQNISRKLDEGQESVPQAQQRSIRHGSQWRPAVVLAVAAGLFWFALIPALPQGMTDSGFPAATKNSKSWKDPGVPDPYSQPAKAPRTSRFVPVADAPPRTMSASDTASPILPKRPTPQ